MVNLVEWLSDPNKLNRETLSSLREMVARYPYFQPVRLLYLKNLYLLHDDAFSEELRKAIIYITNGAFLYHFIEDELGVPLRKIRAGEAVKEESNADDRTLAIIDAFLSSVPEESSYAAIGNGIATDYSTYLMEKEAQEEQSEQKLPMQNPLRRQELIDSFIEKSNEGFAFHKRMENEEEESHEKVPVDETTEIEEESYFTETLAKIYIKQQRYSKAIEIIKKLSLKYPKKNTYFAGQIKDLEKLIINTKSKK